MKKVNFVIYLNEEFTSFYEYYKTYTLYAKQNNFCFYVIFYF